MKNKSFSLYAIIGVVIAVLIILFVLSLPDKSDISQLKNQNQISVPDNYATASISKGMILLLLAVGVIGVLGVSRKKKISASIAQTNETPQATGDHNMNEDKQKIIT